LETPFTAQTLEQSGTQATGMCELDHVIREKEERTCCAARHPDNDPGCVVLFRFLDLGFECIQPAHDDVAHLGRAFALSSNPALVQAIAQVVDEGRVKRLCFGNQEDLFADD
jgi:hypothetical protein